MNLKVKILNATHPEYDAARLEQLDALYHGGRPWEALVNTWLPQHPDEVTKLWELRKARALYHNHMAPIVDMVSAALFSQPPDIQGVNASWFPEWSENVDREGTSLPLFCQHLATSALLGQRAYLWVDLPARPEGIPIVDSLADEERAGLLASYWKALEAEHVIDWAHAPGGGLKWIVVRDVLDEREDVTTRRSKTWRWTHIDAVRIRRWEWKQQPGKECPTDEDEAEELAEVAHGLGRIPVVPLTLPSGLYAGGKLHHPAIAHLRSANDLAWALHKAAHPLLWIRNKWESLDKPVLGPGYYYQVGEDGAVGYAEPSGTSFQLIAERTVELREEMYRVVHQMGSGADSKATRSQASGAAKQQDAEALALALAALAAILKPVIREALRITGKARGVKLTPEIGGLEGWRVEDLTTWLVNVSTAFEAMSLSETFRREVARRQARRLLPDVGDEIVAKIDAEILAADLSQPSAILPPIPVEPDPIGGAP